MMQRIFILIVLLLANYPIFATHNRAGEITYKQLSDFTFEFTVITFTNTKPTSTGMEAADRSELDISWGDGTYSKIPRIELYNLPDYYRKNIYRATHTFAGASTYEILVEDPNRNEGVENIPNSINVVFSIKTILQINPALGFNNTPILLNPPIDKAAVNQIFIHNPAAYDPDGDSLSYEMTVCTGENGEPIANYEFPPSQFEPIHIDPVLGNLVWNTPIKNGAFNVAFNIYEWRKGIKIGRVTRDMQIEVFDTENKPPVIDTIAPVCVIAGETLAINVSAHDNASEIITLAATGGSFAVDTPSVFYSTPSPGVVNGTFSWETQCFHVRKQPYQVVFKATDNNSEVNLVDQLSVDITVIGAAPKNVSLESTNNSILLTWNPYNCQQAKGFRIYRSTTPYGFNPDDCETGVPNYTGFEQIADIMDGALTSFLDNNKKNGLNQGFTYCYMITALFDDNIESKASAEVCGELVRGIPIITNVSVTQHSSNGEMYIAWSKPIDFDTVKFPGSLVYVIKRADGIWGTEFLPIDTLYNFESDTVFNDKNINTLEQAYSYKIEIHNNLGLTEPPMTASSIFPKIDGSNHTITLTLEQNTPWINYEYVIYRQKTGSNTFDSIGITHTLNYIDDGLTNGEDYCYRITSYGQYNLYGILKPLINQSHQNCGMPLDTIPPNSPNLNVESNCTTFINTLYWTLNSPKSEIRKYNIYAKPSYNADLILIDSVLFADSMQYNHLLQDVLAGCYAVTAIDSNGNESEFSNLACVDECTYFELPNVFTPNGDGINDLFIPITPPSVIDNYVDKIDLKIYSRWGNQVYETSNPRINWDGKSTKSDKLLSPGVYYYVCDVYENRLSGVEHRVLTGFVHIFYNEDGTTKE